MITMSKIGIYKNKDLKGTNKNESSFASMVDLWGCFNSPYFLNYFHIIMLFL